MSTGSFVMFVFFIRVGFTTLRRLMEAASKLPEHEMFINDFFDLQNISTSKGYISKSDYFPKPPFQIEILNLSFSYPGTSKEVLEKIHIKIPKGKTVALVGGNGSGKTTLVKLLCGFYQPGQGSIFFNESNIENFSLDILWKNISVLFQDYILYHTSARDNIWFGDTGTDCHIREIIDSAQMTGVHDTLKKLPKGYETTLGNMFSQSAELSLGEWQKLAMARTFYKKAGFYILDEPTSSLDLQTEEEMFKKFETLTRKNTTLLISHRLSTILLADYIYVLDQGKIVEEGRHEELINQKGMYSDLFESQLNRLGQKPVNYI